MAESGQAQRDTWVAHVTTHSIEEGWDIEATIRHKDETTLHAVLDRYDRAVIRLLREPVQPTPPIPQWQRTFPTHDGYYWFWAGENGRRVDEPRIVEVKGSLFWTCGSEQEEREMEFPGYCLGPLLIPAPPEGAATPRPPAPGVDAS